MAEPQLKQASVVLHRLPLDWRTKYSEPGLPCLKTEPDSQDFSNTGCSKVWSSSSEDMGSFSHLDTGHIKTEPDVADSIKQEPPFLQPCSRTEIQGSLSGDLNCMSGLVYKLCEAMDEVRTGRCSQTHQSQKHKDTLYRKVHESQKGVRNHKRIHTGEKPYSCADCGKNFTSSGRLRCHQLLHCRKGTASKGSVCTECGKSFVQRSYLKKHLRVHSGEKPYSCMECGKSFSQDVYLKAHQRVHSSEKPYSCSECGKSFGQPYALKIHQRIHTGERPHSCNECGKSFIQYSHLKKHQGIHSGEKPYICSECGKGFSQVKYLKTHQKIHFVEK